MSVSASADECECRRVLVRASAGECECRRVSECMCVHMSALSAIM